MYISKREGHAGPVMMFMHLTRTAGYAMNSLLARSVSASNTKRQKQAGVVCQGVTRNEAMTGLIVYYMKNNIKDKKG